jgi:hypothetical protein
MPGNIIATHYRWRSKPRGRRLVLKIRREFYGGLTPGAVSGRVSCRLRPSASTSDQTSTMRPQAMRNIFMPVQVAVRLVGSNRRAVPDAFRLPCSSTTKSSFAMN